MKRIIGKENKPIWLDCAKKRLNKALFMYSSDLQHLEYNDSKAASCVGVLSLPQWNRKLLEYKAFIDIRALEPKRSFFNRWTKDPL